MYGYYQHPNAIIRGKKRYYGTGGVILKTLRRFVSSIRSLKRFRLNNLLLESDGDIGACLDELMGTSGETLEYLEILNYTSHIIPLYNIGLFPNLRTLTISSHSLNDDVLLLFANHLLLLSRINIVQDELAIPCRYSDSVWIEIQTILTESKRSWYIQMCTKGKCKAEPFWPGHPAPVRAIVYNTRTTKIVQPSIYACTEQYSRTLEVYVSPSLARSRAEGKRKKNTTVSGSFAIDVPIVYPSVVSRSSGYGLHQSGEKCPLSAHLSH